MIPSTYLRSGLEAAPSDWYKAKTSENQQGLALLASVQQQTEKKLKNLKLLLLLLEV